MYQKLIQIKNFHNLLKKKNQQIKKKKNFKIFEKKTKKIKKSYLKNF